MHSVRTQSSFVANEGSTGQATAVAPAPVRTENQGSARVATLQSTPAPTIDDELQVAARELKKQISSDQEQEIKNQAQAAELKKQAKQKKKDQRAAVKVERQKGAKNLKWIASHETVRGLSARIRFLQSQDRAPKSWRWLGRVPAAALLLTPLAVGIALPVAACPSIISKIVFGAIGGFLGLVTSVGMASKGGEDSALGALAFERTNFDSHKGSSVLPFISLGDGADLCITGGGLRVGREHKGCYYLSRVKASDVKGLTQENIKQSLLLTAKNFARTYGAK